jgi:hypothetical protein
MDDVVLHGGCFINLEIRLILMGLQGIADFRFRRTDAGRQQKE